MGYQTTNGTWVDTLDLTLADEAAAAATADGDALEVGGHRTMSVLLDVTAGAGTTPTLDVAIETSHDGSTGWTEVAAFTQATGVTAQRKVLSGLDRFVRASWTIGGTTPSFDFSVQAEAV